MASVSFHLQGEDGGEVLVHHPLARLLDGLSDQPQDRARRAGKGVEFRDLSGTTLLIGQLPNAVVTARKAMQGLCDLHGVKFLHAMRAGVFLNQRGDGQHDGNKPLWLDACHSKPRQRDTSPLGGRHALEPRGDLRGASFFKEQRDGTDGRLNEAIRFSPEPDIRGGGYEIWFEFSGAVRPMPMRSVSGFMLNVLSAMEGGEADPRSPHGCLTTAEYRTALRETSVGGMDTLRDGRLALGHRSGGFGGGRVVCFEHACLCISRAIRLKVRKRP